MTWNVLQTATNAVSGVVVAATFTSNVSSGTKIIAVVSASTSLNTVSTVQDAALNSWTQITPTASISGGQVSIWALDTPAGDVGTKPTITATFTGSGHFTGITIAEVSGLLPGNTTAMVDGTPGTLTGTAATTSSPSYSSTASGEFLISAYGDNGDNNTVVKTSGWTMAGTNGSGSSNCLLEYTNSTGGSETNGFTGAGTGGWAIVTVAFKLAAGAIQPAQAVIKTPVTPPVPRPPQLSRVIAAVQPVVPETSPGLEVYGFGSFPTLAGAAINSVTVAVTENQSNAAQAACTFQLWDSTTAQIGVTQTGTASTSGGNVSTAVFTGVTYAQLATLRVRVYGNAMSGSGWVESVDAVSLTVNYTPAPGGAGGAALAGTGTLSTGATQQPGVVAAGTGSLTLGAVQRPGVTASGTGALSEAEVQAPSVLASGAGSLTTGVTWLPGVTAAGAGSLITAVTQQPGVSLSGTGALTPGPVLAGGVELSGTGLLTTGPVLAGAALLSGTGALSTAVTQEPGVSLSGTGLLVTAVLQRPGMSLSGTGALSTAVTQEPGVSLSGTGTLTAATGAGAANLSGTGVLTTGVTQQPGAALSGTGSLIAGGAFAGAVLLSGSGALGTGATQQPGAVLSGSGVLSTGVTQAPAVALSGSGALGTGVTTRPGVTASGTGLLTTPGAGFGGAVLLSGTGTLSTAVPRTAGAVLTGSGALSTALSQGPGVTLTGTGSAGVAAAQLPGAALSGTGLLTTPGGGFAGGVLLSGTGVLTAAALQLITITDTDSCVAVESGFAFILSSETCTAAEAAWITVADTDSCQAAERELTAWPSDTDSCSAAERELTAWPRDAEVCVMADGGEIMVLTGTETCAAADATGPDIEVYTYVPPAATGPGGGFEVIWGDRVVLRAARLDGQVLRFARELARAREVRFVSDADVCTAAEAQRPAASVAVSVVPALEVSIQVSSDILALR